MWVARLTTYIGAGLAGLAFLAASMGYATYDAATGMVDLHPINVWALAGIIGPVVGNALGAVAVWRGWSK